MRAIAAAAFLVMSLASAVRAEINHGFTVEWLTHDSFLVALATPIEAQTADRTTKYRFRLDDVIKGPHCVGDTVTIFTLSVRELDAHSLVEALKAGTQMLVFAKVAEYVYNVPSEIDGKYYFAQQICSSAYFSNVLVKDLYTPDFHIVSKFEDLVYRSKAQATKWERLKRRYRQVEVRKQLLEVPFDSEAYKQLFAGSTCFLYVPEFIPTDQESGVKP